VTGFSNLTIASFLSEPTVNTSFAALNDISALDYMIIYQFFGLLWTTSFILGCSSMIIAGTIAAWYFSRMFFFSCCLQCSLRSLFLYYIFSLF
jgi:Plasma-membrane choline transporter